MLTFPGSREHALIDTPCAADPCAADDAPRYPLGVMLRDGSRITIRPIGPHDEAREQAFVRALSPESRYFRFMNTLRELPPETLQRFTHPDPDREIALVALANQPATDPTQVAVARCVLGANGACEFAIVVADEVQGKGLGHCLMNELMRAAGARGARTIEGQVLAGNHPMLALMQSLGFDIITPAQDPRIRQVVNHLD
jgi:acetyltransferase